MLVSCLVAAQIKKAQEGLAWKGTCACQGSHRAGQGGPRTPTRVTITSQQPRQQLDWFPGGRR